MDADADACVDVLDMLGCCVAVVQLPVLKGLLRALNNQRIGATGTIATYIPLRQNIDFHKVRLALTCVDCWPVTL